MVKPLLSRVFIFLLLASTFLLKAQQFEVLPLTQSLIGSTGKTVSIPLQIKNQGEKPQFFIIRLTEDDLRAGQKGYFCLNGNCLSPDITEISKRIEGSSTLSGLTYVVETGLATGQSQLTFEFSIKGNPAGSIDWPVTIMVDEKQPKNVVFRSKDITIHEVYPNPVTSTAYIDYELYNEKKAAKIIIHNILGTSMGEQELSFNESRAKILTEDFSPGIYFYTVYLDNEGLITRKMVVRR